MLDHKLRLDLTILTITPLGQIAEYTPTVNETLICLGIWAMGLLLYTIFLRMSVPILQGRLSKDNETRARDKTGVAAARA